MNEGEPMYYSIGGTAINYKVYKKFYIYNLMKSNFDKYADQLQEREYRERPK